MSEDLGRERYVEAWLEKQRLNRPAVGERERRRRKAAELDEERFAQGLCEARLSRPERRCVLPYGHTGKHKWRRGL